MIQRFYDGMEWWSIPRVSDLLVQILAPPGLGGGRQGTAEPDPSQILADHQQGAHKKLTGGTRNFLS